jgi:hypothetical protein
MWQILNLTPFAADRAWVRDQTGAEVWLVAVKCTFDIRPDGTTVIAEDQPPVLNVPEYHGEPGGSSIRLESDLLLTKTTTDVIISGHAFSPGDRPVTQLEAGFQLDTLLKMVRITGDRVWTTAGPSSPATFTKMPLIYERAFGGVDRNSQNPERDFDWRNPVGTGFAMSREHLDGVALPNIEYPHDPVRSWADRPVPAGFGPIACNWESRARLAGTYGEEWQKRRQPLLPDDFDIRFFQCAPEDQRSPQFLRGGEQMCLFNLSPFGDICFSLPKLFLGFETRFADRSRQFHQDRKLHSVIVDTDYPRVSLVWHSALPCHFKVQKLLQTIVSVRTPLSGSQSIQETAELELT